MTTGKAVLGILAGTAIGAGLGILFAPDSGSNTRKKISRKGQDYVDGLSGQFNKMASSIGQEFNMLKDEVNQLSDNTKAKLNEFKKDVPSTIS